MSRRWRGERTEEGFSLVELLVSMTIFGGLMALIMSIFIMSFTQAKDATARAETADQARLAIAQLDSQIRSGSVIQDPSAESYGASGVIAGYSVRILTERDGIQTCAQWRVWFDDGEGTLQFRSWPAWTPAEVTNWRLVASGIVKPEGTPTDGDPTTYLPFAMQEPLEGEAIIKTLLITLRIKAEGTTDSAEPTLVTTSVTGRNTIFGSAGLECSSVPTP